jgi:hypothetical protein
VTADLGRFVAFDRATSPGLNVPRTVTTAVLIAITDRPVPPLRWADFAAPVDSRRP